MAKLTHLEASVQPPIDLALRRRSRALKARLAKLETEGDEAGLRRLLDAFEEPRPRTLTARRVAALELAQRLLPAEPRRFAELLALEEPGFLARGDVAWLQELTETLAREKATPAAVLAWLAVCTFLPKRPVLGYVVRDDETPTDAGDRIRRDLKATARRARSRARKPR